MGFGKYIGLGILMFFSLKGNSQDFLKIKGQLSAFTHFNAGNEYPWWNGGRYIPQVNFDLNPEGDKRIDFEASANLFGNIGLKGFEDTRSNGNIKPYRVWGRYSTNQLELRVGLQKINFGSASILRPLMWFDQVDPRDPLQLTDGVWGVLGRYYFLNNTTLWLWALHGNNKPKGWEMVGTNRSVPEFGGRIQVPVSSGEAALAYHYRVADSRALEETKLQFARIPEHRIGFDAKFDWVVGYWIEASWKNMGKDMGIFSNQEILNLGVDYTFGVGNGLTVIHEQLFVAFDEKPFAFNNSTLFSLLSATYPVGLFDTLSYILYFDWGSKSAYNFINWQRKFNNITLHIMGYMNPKNYEIPTQQVDEKLFAGTGVQLMLVFNH
jgi:hypothetical protein